MFIKISKEKNTFNMQNIIPNIQSRGKIWQCSLKKMYYNPAQIL